MKGWLSRTQQMAKAARKAKASARLNIVRHACADGLSKTEAARLAGLTDAGLNTLLRREIGSTVWPLLVETPNDGSIPSDD